MYDAQNVQNRFSLCVNRGILKIATIGFPPIDREKRVIFDGSRSEVVENNPLDPFV